MKEFRGIPPGKPVASEDVHMLRQLLGLDGVDLIYLSGQMAYHYPSKGKRASAPLEKKHPFSLLVRYLTAYPEDNILPIWPTMEETILKLNNVYHESMISWGEQGAPSWARSMTPGLLGILVGTSKWVGESWARAEKATTPTEKVVRLFKLLCDLVDKYRAEGLRRYIEIVDQHAVSYGHSGLEAVVLAGKWVTRSPRKSRKALKD